MKIECTKNHLLKGLQLVANVVNDRQTIPVLANVLIEAEASGTITLSATDLKMGLNYEFSGDVSSPGCLTVPAKKIVSIVKELPDQVITLEAEGNAALSLTCGKSQFKILGLPKEEFPNIAALEDPALVLPQKSLRDALKKVVIAISTDTSRYVLTGILCKIQDDTLSFVATDGRRLAYVSLGLPENASADKQVIIPAKLINELLKVLGDEGEVSMTIGEKEVAFDMQGISYISQLIDGKYPNYQQVIPKESQFHLSIDRNMLYSAVKRSTVLTDQKLNRVRLEVKKNLLKISTKTPELGESEEEIDIQNEENEMEIGFNPTYILDALKNVSSENVQLGLSDPNKAGVITAEDNFLYVIMPMKLVG